MLQVGTVVVFKGKVAVVIAIIIVLEVLQILVLLAVE